jgi:hypothetical protein
VPYLIGATSTDRFAYFSSGAIRRLSATEYAELKSQVRVITLTAADVTLAKKVSATLFGV